MLELVISEFNDLIALGYNIDILTVGIVIFIDFAYFSCGVLVLYGFYCLFDFVFDVINEVIDKVLDILSSFFIKEKK